MWTLLAFGAVASITIGLTAVGLTIWRDWRRLIFGPEAPPQ
jgi:hypothetical protein